MKYGLDLSKHYEDVVKIAHSKFPFQGADTDDLIQDTCKKILKANLGAHPYDPRKSSPGHYIYIALNSVFLNEKAKRSRDPVTVLDEWEEVGRLLDEQVAVIQEDKLLGDFQGWLEEKGDRLPCRVLRLRKMGYSRKEVAQRLDESLYRVDKVRERLRELGAEFRNGGSVPAE